MSKPSQPPAQSAPQKTRHDGLWRNQTPPKNIEKNPRYAGVDPKIWRRFGRRVALLNSTDMRVREAEEAVAHAQGERARKEKERLAKMMFGRRARNNSERGAVSAEYERRREAHNAKRRALRKPGEPSLG